MFGKTTEEWAAWNGALAQCEEPEALVQTLTCQHCHVPGKLTSEIDQTHACPSCKERELVVESSWIT
jgi:rubrerythrin